MTTDLPDEQVLVTTSSCKVCGGWVTNAVAHMMTSDTIRHFEDEVKAYNLSVSTHTLIEYRESKQVRCDCV